MTAVTMYPLKSQDSHVNTCVLLNSAWGLIYCHSHPASPVDGQRHVRRCPSLHHQHPVPPVLCWGLVQLLQPFLPGVAMLVGGIRWPATSLPGNIRHPVPSPERGTGVLGATTPEP